MKLKTCLGLGFHRQKAVGSLPETGQGARKQMVWNEGGRGLIASAGADCPRASAGRKARASFVTFFSLGSFMPSADTQ